MLALIDLENRAYSRWEESLARQLAFKYLIEDLSSEECQIIRYNQLNPYNLNDLDIKGVILSGNFSDWDVYDQEDLDRIRAFFKAGKWPTLAICGSFQLMAESYGARIGPMEANAPTLVIDDEPLLFDLSENDSSVGSTAELGFTNLNSNEQNLINANLPETFTVYEYHYWSVNTIPEGFVNVATSQRCKIQLLSHKTKPLFGCEFHPEMFTEEHPHGKQILLNFFNFVKSYTSNDLPMFA